MENNKNLKKMEIILNKKNPNNSKLKIKDKFKNLEKLKNIKPISNLPNLTTRSKQNESNINNRTKLIIQAYTPKNINMNNNTNNFNFYSPVTSSQFHKINQLSPLNHLKKYNFLLKKNKSLQNLNIRNDNTSQILPKAYNTMNKSKYISSFDNNSMTKTLKKQFSNYFYKSQSSLYSSRRIFRHYIRESENDKITPETFFYKTGAPKPKKELDELYKLNINYHKRIQELKYNKSIAFKKDFNVMKYQSTLLKLISKKMSLKNIKELQKGYVNLNQKIFGLGIAPRGRFSNLAEKIKYNVPLFLYERIKQLDKEKLMSRYNYYKKAHENVDNKFEKIYYSTHKRLFKKNQGKNSYVDNKDNIMDKYSTKNKTKNRNIYLKINNNNFNYSF